MGWWRWALVSPDGVVPSRKVGMSASVNLPLHHEVQKFSSGTASSGKKGREMVVVGGVVFKTIFFNIPISNIGCSSPAMCIVLNETSVVLICEMSAIVCSSRLCKPLLTLIITILVYLL